MSFINEYGSYIISGVISAITGIVAFFAGRRQSLAEVKLVESDVAMKASEIYNTLVMDLGNIVDEVKELRLVVEDLTSKARILEKELDDCRNGITKYNETD